MARPQEPLDPYTSSEEESVMDGYLSGIESLGLSNSRAATPCDMRESRKEFNISKDYNKTRYTRKKLKETKVDKRHDDASISYIPVNNWLNQDRIEIKAIPILTNGIKSTSGLFLRHGKNMTIFFQFQKYQNGLCH